MDPQSIVDQLPDSALLNIFSYLNAKEIIAASFACRRWFRVGQDEQLWKRRMKVDFNLANEKMGRAGVSWLGEYRRLMDECPRVAERSLQAHSEVVLHVCFSHDGRLLATCSKDGTVKVWATCSDWRVVHDKNLRQLLYWRHALCASFNRTDRLLLLSGLRANEPAANGVSPPGLGELAVFEFVKKPAKPVECDQRENSDCSCGEEELVFRCRAINEPFDVYGCWLDGESILNGQSRRFNRTASMTDLYFLHAASEQTTSTRLFQFYNPAGGVVRSLLVSSYGRANGDKLLVFTTGRRADTPHQIGVKVVKSERVTAPLEAAAKSVKMRSDNPPPAVTRKALVRKVELTQPTAAAKPKEETAAEAAPTTAQEKEQVGSEKEQSSAGSEQGRAEGDNEKQAGAAAEKEQSSEEESEEEQEPPPHQPQVRMHSFDRVDEIIETHGRIVGLALSPDQRYLFVHLRPFVDEQALHDFAHPNAPPIPSLDRLEIRVIDLSELALLSDRFVGQPCNGPGGDGGGTVDVDANEDYVLSGGDEHCVHLWDRRHGCLIRSLAHQKGRSVRAVAFHPTLPGACVSADDQGSVLIWVRKRTKDLSL